jgi:hypothetical protein
MLLVYNTLNGLSVRACGVLWTSALNLGWIMFVTYFHTGRSIVQILIWVSMCFDVMEYPGISLHIPGMICDHLPYALMSIFTIFTDSVMAFKETFIIVSISSELVTVPNDGKFRGNATVFYPIDMDIKVHAVIVWHTIFRCQIGRYSKINASAYTKMNFK